MLRKMIMDCLTERDGEKFDVVRILGCFAFFSFHILAFIHIIVSPHDLNFLEIATGLSILLGIIAAGTTYKYSKE